MNIIESFKDKKKVSLSLKIAENQYEIEKALSLRFDVFNKELGKGLHESYSTCKDRDDYDLFCDHLLVIDKFNNDKVVGTYRILKSNVAKRTIGFYSENEFDLFNLYQNQDDYAEVGRSCIHHDYRDGSVINLLWQGLAHYMNEFNLKFYFGCASIHSTSHHIINQVYNYLLLKNAFTEHYIPPLTNYHEEIKILEKDLINQKFIPPLIKGYLRLGAKFSSYPAIDLEFGTTDFFVLFTREHITKKYNSRFSLNK